MEQQIVNEWNEGGNFQAGAWHKLLYVRAFWG